MAKQIIVSVNGTIVKQPELMYRLEYLPFNTPTGIQPTGIKVMQDILTLILQEQFAEKMKAMPTHEQFKRKFAEVSAATGFAQRLEQGGESLPEFKRRLRIEMAQESLLTQGIKVNEEDIRRYYNLNIDPKNPKALYYHPETATVFVVVTATTEACSSALNELATGVQPASVASHYSILDPAQAPRGILPPIHRGRGELKQIPGLEKAIFKLQINEQTPALVLGGKWWIIRCHNRVPASVDAFEKVREECRHTVALQQGVSDRRLELEKEFAAFRKRANIQLFWQQYAPVVKTIKQ